MNQLSFLAVAMFLTLSAFAQKDSSSISLKKELNALRIDSKISIDGLLDEFSWKEAEIAGNFVQNEPVPGVPCTQKTVVKVLYDNSAIYIGAFLYDSAPDSIPKELSLRDDLNNVDWFEVDFDAYKSGIDGLGFWVTSAGVQGDSKYSIFNEDTNWNAVWESEISFNENGWVVEIRIPYSAIRFSDQDEQEWGLNFIRMIRNKRERAYWNEVKPNVEGYFNQAGILKGIKGIKAPVRLSVTPYVSAVYEHYREPATGYSSFTQGYNGGMDIKYGINDAFTLDMTLIPDFNQVQSDDQELNLSPFELEFNENRQFFTEGFELFNKANIFYSRRIGGRPLNYFGAEDDLKEGEILLSNPSTDQLLNAMKISGRTNSGLGVGFFNAITGQMEAIIEDSTGNPRSFETSPLTNYNVFAVDQNLKNNSYVSLINTNVLRNGETYDANVTGTEFLIRNKKGSYSVSGSGAYSRRYHPEEITKDDGYKYNVGVAKTSGNFQTNLNYNVESENYNPNDLGFLYNPNERSVYLGMNYGKYEPFSIFNRARVNLYIGYQRLYDPNVFQSFFINPNIFFFTKNAFAFGSWASLTPVVTYDYFEPRVNGRVYDVPKNNTIAGWISTDYRKRFALDVNVNTRKFDEDGRYRLNLDVSPRMRFNDKFTVVYNLGSYNQYNNIGFVNELNNGDIIFGRRDRNTIENTLYSSYIFNNKMGITFRARHYWSKVEYNRFNLLETSGELGITSYDGIEIEIDEEGNETFIQTHNVNFNAFTIDLQYTWQFAPGSELSFVWKNGIYNSDYLVDLNYFENIQGMQQLPQTNNFSLKILYFLDYVNVRNMIDK